MARKDRKAARRFTGVGRLLLAATIAACGCLPSARAESEQPLARFEFTETHMGMPVKFLLYAGEQKVANSAAQAAYARIAQLDQCLSDYKPDSELMKLCATAGTKRAVPLSPDLYTVLARAQQLAQATDGAFDVTVGPLVRLWRRARREKQLPTAQRLAEAVRAVGHQALILDAEARTATLLKPGMRLDLGGIGMGYAVDEAMRVLKQHGVSRALIDASGDILVSEPPPGETGWKIGIAPLDPQGAPYRYVLLSNQAVSTAGDAFQNVVIDGKRYSHIVDPKTGLGLSQSSLVAVIAPDCITSDSLDTAVSVLGPRRGLPLVDATPAAAAVFLQAEGEPAQLRAHESKRFAAIPAVRN